MIILKGVFVLFVVVVFVFFWFFFVFFSSETLAVIIHSNYLGEAVVMSCSQRFRNKKNIYQNYLPILNFISAEEVLLTSVMLVFSLTKYVYETL